MSLSLLLSKGKLLMNGTTKSKKGSRKKIIIIGVILLVVAVIVAFLFVPGVAKMGFPGASSQTVGGYTLYSAQRRDISTTLSGSGTLQPYDSYSVTATVSGDIIFSDFEEMAQVNEGDVLYIIESSSVEDDIEEKKRDVQDALDDYNDALDDMKNLDVLSVCYGTVRDVYVEEGDRVSDGTKIAYVVDSETMLIELPFFSTDADFIKVGDKGYVTFSLTGEVLDAVVCEISNLKTLNSNNSFVRNITLSVKNPGGIAYGMKAYAAVYGAYGTEYFCSAEGSFEYNCEETIVAEISGEIENLFVTEGDTVYKNSKIATIYSETLQNQIKQYKKSYDNQLNSLDDLIERLEDHTITAPISGTIVQKNYKVLDTIGGNTNSSNTTLAIIYDMSKLTFDMSIDELDLEKIKVGQKVIITSDSIKNEIFEGVVTKKSIVGSSSGGTTVYPVTVEIEGNDRLLPGMNINAEIVISSSENVLTVPTSAVKRGNKIEILKNPTADTKLGVVSEKPETEVVEVTLGASNSDYVEITSGLSEGDIVVAEITNVSQNAFSSMFGMGGMGMSGMPGGMGMSGGMPSMSGGMGGSGSRPNMSGGMPGGMGGSGSRPNMSGGMPGGMGR